MTIEDLYQLVIDNYPDQFEGLITPEKERQVLNAIISMLGGEAGGARIISFSFEIISDTSGEVTAEWFDDVNNNRIVTDQPITFLGTPGAGNFRWDLIKLNYDGTVSVISGTEGATPIRPSEGTNGMIAGEVIWNELGEFEIVLPDETFPDDRFLTEITFSNNNQFAKILSGIIVPGQLYALQLSYTNFSSDWVLNGKGGTGILNVTFLGEATPTINPAAVQIETFDGNSDAADWSLIDTGLGTWDLWHKSKAFWGRAQFRVLMLNSAVSKSWFINNAPYVAAIPTISQQFNSVVAPIIPNNSITDEKLADMLVNTFKGRKTAGTGDPENLTADEVMEIIGYPDYAPDTGNIKFTPLNGKPRKYGFTTALTGNIVFDPAGAKEGIMIKIRHNHTVAPTFSVLGGGVDLVFEGGEYQPSTNNFIYAICHKNDVGALTFISYTFNNNQV